MKLRIGTITKDSHRTDGKAHFNLYDCVPIEDASTEVLKEAYLALFSDRIINIPVSFFDDDIVDVIFHDPATIVKWKDGTKTVVKCQKDKGDVYNPEQGLAMCIVKKICGNKGNYNDIFTKWLPKENNNEETI